MGKGRKKSMAQYPKRFRIEVGKETEDWQQ
jgi:hypothetical protein